MPKCRCGSTSWQCSRCGEPPDTDLTDSENSDDEMPQVYPQSTTEKKDVSAPAIASRKELYQAFWRAISNYDLGGTQDLVEPILALQRLDSLQVQCGSSAQTDAKEDEDSAQTDAKEDEDRVQTDAKEDEGDGGDENNEDHECTVCNEQVQCTHQCSICNDTICSSCVTKGTFSLWDVVDVSLKCATCSALMCDVCARFCGGCANSAINDVDSYCSDCQPKHFKKTDCHLHEWFDCGLHDTSGECGECTANRNYCGRYGGY